MHGSGSVEIRFGNDGDGGGTLLGAMDSREHGAASRDDGSEFHQADGLDDIVVDGLHPALHQVGLMPEAGAA